MNGKPQLLELPTRELLEKIGAGNHKPGSGSAAALNGIISCRLLLTVIQLTLDPKRYKHYNHCSAKCIDIQKKVSERIGPRLEELFQEDSEQFDKTITKRQERNSEKNQARKNRLEQEAQEELVNSTEFPIEIAELSLELAGFSIFVFDNGFKSARGDSSVALSSAASSISGCLSIISLNLQSFPSSNWTDDVRNRSKAIRKEYERLMIEISQRMNKLDNEAEMNNKFLAEINEIRNSLHGKPKLTTSEIEGLARRIQNTLWLNREKIWKTNVPDNLFGVLSSVEVIKLLKYAFHEVDTLGVTNTNQEIGGIINNKNMTIHVSSKFSHEVKNFTTAHELGHALLHDRIELHRDIPMDGSNISQARPIEEIQADKFATFFLMPEKVVRRVFEELFQAKQLTLNEQTAFALGRRSVRELRVEYGTLRDWSRMVARLEYFDNLSFTSMANTFRVSFEAMAIRLEELGLVSLQKG